jgi:hypothetical protein
MASALFSSLLFLSVNMILFLHTAGTLVRLHGHGKNFFVYFSDLILEGY